MALKGLGEVSLVVQCPHAEATARTGITESSLNTTLNADLLGSNTVRIIARKAGAPWIYLNVGLLPLGKHRATVLAIDFELHEAAFTWRPQGWKIVPWTTTWAAAGWLGVNPDDTIAAKIKDVIRDTVDDFTIAWRGANSQGED